MNAHPRSVSPNDFVGGETEEHYRSVVESQAEMLCRFRPDGTILFVNGAYARARGTTPDGLMGRNFWDFVAEEDRPAVREMLDRLAPQAPEIRIENRFETTDGVRWTLWTNRALRFDVEGRWTEAQSAGIDITERKQAEEKLRESEERYRRLISLLPAAVYTCEAPSGVITFYNDRAAELWGRSPTVGDTDERFCGSFKLYRPDGTPLPHDQAPMAVAVQKSREFRNEEVVIERPDGSRITTLVNIGPIFNASGHLVGAVNVFHDTTPLKQAEQAKARLAAIVESSEDAIISKDLSGTITSWNQGAERLFGYTAQEAMGQPVSILIPRERLNEEPGIRERIRRGERIEHYETVRRRKDGTLLDISLTVSPIVDEHGVIVGASKIARDISSRKKAEAKLRESEGRFRTVADSSPIMIWMTDPQGKAVFFNSIYREYFAISPDDPAAFDWAAVIHPDDREAYVGAFRTALEKRQVFHHRVRLRRFDGQWRWFESRGNPILDDSGNVAGFIGSSPDISEIYESELKLKELDQRKDEFLANMSHEIRSPLTGIMGYADILLSKLKDTEHIQYLKTIKESGDYLIEIVNDILDLSKIEAGKLVLNIEPVSPHALLGEIHGLMDVRAREKNLPLVLRYDGVVPAIVQTDRTRLRQIVINLVSNAIKFTERGRVEIVVEFVKNQDLLKVEVIDTGIGIAPEHQAHLFEPFTQADSTSRRKYEGTGLGLTITKRLSEMLGGSISFESELGKGSTFRVMIPIAPAQGASMLVDGVLPDEPAVGDLPLRDRHVLVVDDRKEFCYLVSRYIQDAGGRTTARSDGEAAIEAIQSAENTDPFHAVVMDIQMAGTDGYETTRRLRAKGFRKPIIALTAGAMLGDREKCLQAGCDDYLTKPIDRRALVKLLTHYADKSAAAFNGKLKVLVVDDSHAACELLRRYLEKRGHEVRTAHDGQSALRLAQQFRPDAVVVDIRLPDMDGYKLTQRLKETDGVGAAMFVAVSGYREDDIPEKSSVEFDHFLEKPLDLAQLDKLLNP